MSLGYVRLSQTERLMNLAVNAISSPFYRDYEVYAMDSLLERED